MKTAIYYVSKYGTTAKCAQLLNEKLKDGAKIFNLQDKKMIASKEAELELYDTIIIGGSIHAGGLHGAVKKFCKKNKAVLLKKKTGIYLCTLAPAENAISYFDKNLPADLLAGIKAKGCFGGEVIYGKMNALERMIMKKITGSDKDISRISLPEIDKFIQELK